MSEEKKIEAKKVLVTGGSGYIGSHTVLELVNAGYHVTIVDNLVNSSPESLTRVKKLSGKANMIVFHELDACDPVAFEKVFKDSGKFDAVIHFAGLKAVGESVSMPLTYYRNNLDSTLVMLELMDKYECRNLVFSSSATVYGAAERGPSEITEDYPLSATNPYGKTKLFIEEILRDVAVSNPGKWKLAILRYFNPIGCHESGLIGEDPNGIPNNLSPYILQVASGKRDHLNVFGNDYDTPDGTGVRDYIDVVDLAKGHVAALDVGIFGGGIEKDVDEINLGTGRGVSVLEMLAAIGKAAGTVLKHKIVARRPGDVGTCVCNPAKAKKVLKWEATVTIEQSCLNGWKWQSSNPNGYKEE